MRDLTVPASLLTAVLFASSAAMPQAPLAPPPAELAARVQERYDRIRDFTADFVHIYEGGILRRRRESGVVQVRKPGRMRWEYQKPEHKIFVSDGRQMYLHEVAANHVTIFSAPEGEEAGTAVLFILGRGHITRDFTIERAENSLPGVFALRLTPKSPEPDYDWLVLAIDQQSLLIQSLSTADNQGGRSTFEFSNIRENTGIPDRVFTFTIPKSAHVVKADSSR